MELIPLPTIIHRTTILPLNAIVNLPTGVNEISNLLQNKDFLDAILIASPTLHEEVLKWFKKTEKSIADKVVIACLKYYCRMASRPTPFGLFAGVSVLNSDGRHKFINISTSCDKKFYRLDYKIIEKITEYLKYNNQINRYLKYYSNSTINCLTNSIRYIAKMCIDDQIQYELIEISLDHIIFELLGKSKNGIYIDELIKFLEDKGLNSDESNVYVTNLIKNTILISELESTLTGNEFNNILRILEKSNLGDDNNVLNKLKNIDAILYRLNTKHEDLNANYKLLAMQLGDLGINYKNESILQIDLLHPQNVEIKSSTIDRISKSINFISNLCPPSTSTNIELFKERFLKKYGGQVISLLSALDPDIGIPYQDAFSESEFVTGVTEGTVGQLLNYDRKWSARDMFLFDKYIESITSANDIVEISEVDANIFNSMNANIELGVSFSAIISIFNNDTDNEIVQLLGVNSLSASRVISRFAHMHESIFDLLKEIGDHENEKFSPRLVVDLKYLQDFKFGNISSHKSFREFEIPILSSTGDYSNNRILLDDLFLTIRNDKLILFSKSHNCEIIPILSSAENYNYGSISLYKFLVDYGYSFWPSSISFSWGQLLSYAKILPRVTYNGVILSPKTWNFKVDSLLDLIEFINSHNLKEIASWREKYKIPRIANLSIDEDDLVIDFSNLTSLYIFSNVIRKYKNISITESLYFIDNKYMENDELKYSNQFIISYCNDNIIKSRNNPFGDLLNINCTGNKGLILPLDKWIYYKIYCSENIADRIISGELRNVILNLKHSGHVAKFFFIRYNDPEFHIRVRLWCNDISSIQSISNVFNENINSLIKDGFVSNIYIDTYHQEIERYGKDQINLIEDLFCVDSFAIMNIIASKSINMNIDNRTIIGISIVNKTFDDFGFNLVEKHEVLLEYLEYYDPNLKYFRDKRIELDVAYRNLESKINCILRSTSINILEYPDIAMILNRKSVEIIGVLNEYQLGKDTARNHIKDIIHMTLNRIAPKNFKFFELSIIYFLSKYCKKSLLKFKYR